MQNFRTLRQPLLGELAMSRKKKRERREKNAIYSGHLRLCQQPRAVHALRSDQNSDDILILKKAKDENSVAIRHLGAKIDTLDKEIEKTMEAVKDKTVQHEKKVKHDESVYSLECKMCSTDLWT